MDQLMNCPKCNCECWRDSCDVGVGIIYGPWGCPECGWSEDSEYDRSEGQPYIHGDRIIDQWGGSMGITRLVEDMFDETT
jgi:hypothetical protein